MGQLKVHAWESVPRAQGFGQQGVWRQTCSKSLQTSKVAAMYDVSLVKSRGQFVDLQACCGCLEGQMDGELEKEQIDTLS
eukprot:1161019-Pelagomonas_calceolata.AAC.1